MNLAEAVHPSQERLPPIHACTSSSQHYMISRNTTTMSLFLNSSPVLRLPASKCITTMKKSPPGTTLIVYHNHVPHLDSKTILAYKGITGSKKAPPGTILIAIHHLLMIKQNLFPSLNVPCNNLRVYYHCSCHS